MKSKTIGEVKVCRESAERLGVLSEYYNKKFMERVLDFGMPFYTGKVRNKRVPKYFKVTIPVIRSHFCEDTCESGLFITTKEINLFRIGTEVIKVPVMRKFKKGVKVRFKRYSKLKV